MVLGMESRAPCMLSEHSTKTNYIPSCPELFALENLYFFKEGKRERGGEGERMLMSCKSVSQSEVCMFFMLVNELIFITSTVTFLLRNCSSWPCNALCSPGRTFHQQSILVLEFHELIKFFLFSAEEHVLNKHGAVYKKAELVHN